MSSNDVIAPKNIDISKIRFSSPKTGKGSVATTVYINYGSSKLTFQTPVMRMPFGITDVNEMLTKMSKKTEDKKYYVNLEFNDIENNPKMRIFRDKMVELQDFAAKKAFDNRMEWFNDDFGDDFKVFMRSYTPIIKYSKDKETKKPTDKYPPYMKVKIPYDPVNDQIYNNFDTFNMDTNEKINLLENMNSMRNGSAMFVLQVTGIWIISGKCGITIRPLMASFKPSNVSRYNFINDSDDEAPGASGAVSASAASHIINSESEEEEEVKPEPPRHVIPDSEGSEDDESSEDDAPPPPPKPSRKARK